MQLREKKTISGELGMQSMTDIIFILLMFFMMTSALVHPSAIDLSVPGKGKITKNTNPKALDHVKITGQGAYLLNGRSIPLDQLELFIRNKVASHSEKFNFIITPSDETPVEYVVAVMDAAIRTGAHGILNVKPPKK